MRFLCFFSLFFKLNCLYRTDNGCISERKTKKNGKISMTSCANGFSIYIKIRIGVSLMVVAVTCKKTTIEISKRM